MLYIKPDPPWENAYSETFISRFGDESLKREEFTSLLEAKVLWSRRQKATTTTSDRTALLVTVPQRSLKLCANRSV